VFEAPIASLRHKVELALQTAVGGLFALAAAFVAIAFFCAAAFLRIAEHYGAIAASLALGGAFLALSILCVLTVVVLHRRKPPPPPPRKSAPWNDPALLAAALDVGRTLGGRRLASAVLLGAFVAGVLLGRPPRKRDP
jgi:hypothetical protein